VHLQLTVADPAPARRGLRPVHRRREERRLPRAGAWRAGHGR